MQRLSMTLLLLCLGGCLDSKSPEQYMQLANDAYREQDYRTSIVELKNSLKVLPDYVDARIFLAKNYLLTGNFLGAKKELNMALRLGGERDIIQPLLLRVHIYLADYKSIEALLKSTEGLSIESLIEVQTVAAIEYIFNREFALGNELLVEVLFTKTENNFYFKLSKYLKAALDEQLELALIELDKLTKDDSIFHDSSLLLAKLQLVNKDLEQSKTTLTHYLTFHPYNDKVRVILADIYIRLNQRDEAQKNIDLVLKKYPNMPTANELKAEVLMLNQNYKEAVEYASVALALQPNLFKSNLISGIGKYQQGQLESAYNHLSIVESSLPSNHLAKQIFLELQFKLGYTEAAIYSLENRLDFEQSDLNVLSMASMALIKSGHQQKAREYIDKMSQLETEDATQLSKRGVLKLSVDDTSGIKDLKKAVVVAPEFEQARLALLYQYINKNQFDEALELAQQWVLTMPNKDSGYLAIGIVYSRKNQIKLAKQAFRKAIDVNPSSVGAYYHLSLFEIADKNMATAFKYSEKALLIDPNHSGNLQNLVMLIALSKKVNTPPDFESQRVITLLEKNYQNTKSTNVLLALAKSYHLQGEGMRALAMLSAQEESLQHHIPYLTAFANISQAQRDYRKSADLYSALIKLDEKNYNAHIGLITSLELQKLYQQALTTVVKTQAVFPESKSLQGLEAHFLILIGTYQQAQDLLNQLTEDDIGQRLYLSLHSQLHFKQKHFIQAKRFAKPLYELHANAKNTLSYAYILSQTNDLDAAISVLNSGLVNYPNSTPMQQLFAELNLSSSPEKSLEIYKQLLTNKPNDATLLNNLAWSATIAKHYDIALANAQKAFKINHSSGQINDTLGVVYMRTGDFENAEKHLLTAIKLLPNNQETSLHYAELLIRLNKAEQAKALLAQISESAEKQNVIRLLEDPND